MGRIDIVILNVIGAVKSPVRNVSAKPVEDVTYSRLHGPFFGISMDRPRFVARGYGPRFFPEVPIRSERRTAVCSVSNG